MTTLAEAAPRPVYDTLADVYDLLTAAYCHEQWLERIEGLARSHGLSGHRLLDVACGTGESFLPLLQRGYQVTACDVSSEMASRAAAKAPGAHVFVADMRHLPHIQGFDLVTCLDDSLNYLLERDDLRLALGGIRMSLDPVGIAVWDVNTLATYRTGFASDWVTDSPAAFIAWHGCASEDFATGEIAEARIDTFCRAEPGCWRRATSVHRQRHWRVADVTAAAAAAGLRVIAVHGQHRGAVLEDGVDELIHAKALFVACRDDRPSTREEVTP